MELASSEMGNQIGAVIKSFEFKYKSNFKKICPFNLALILLF